jgi:hypothetical protein
MGCMLCAKRCALARDPCSAFLSSARIGNSTILSSWRRYSESRFTLSLRLPSIAWRLEDITRG